MVEEDNSVRGTQPRSLAEAVEEFLKAKGITHVADKIRPVVDAVKKTLEEKGITTPYYVGNLGISVDPTGVYFVAGGEGWVTLASMDPGQGVDSVTFYRVEGSDLPRAMTEGMERIDKGNSLGYFPQNVYR